MLATLFERHIFILLSVLMNLQNTMGFDTCQKFPEKKRKIFLKKNLILLTSHRKGEQKQFFSCLQGS